MTRWHPLEPADDEFRLPLKVMAPVLKAGLGQIPSVGQRYFAKHA
jgi:hypothetical protein